MAIHFRANETRYRPSEKDGSFEKQVSRKVKFSGTADEVKAAIDVAAEGLIQPRFSIGVEYDEESYYSNMEGEAHAYVFGWVVVGEDEAELVRAAIVAEEEAEAERAALVAKNLAEAKALQAAAKKKQDKQKKAEARKALADIKKNYPELLK